MSEAPSKGEVMRLIEKFYAAKVERCYGREGGARLLELVTALDAIHESLAYEKLEGGLTVVIALKDGKKLLGAKAMELTPRELPPVVEGAATIQVLGDRLLVVPECREPLQFAKDAVVYHFHGHDYFVIEGELDRVINTSSSPSLFGTPTFLNLEEVLDDYKANQALYSQCEILREHLWSDDRRWWFANKPEDVLQRSLRRHVRATLRGVGEVRREQVVGTRPTDLKVTWSFTNRIAYVEIKWLGASLNKEKTKVSKRYSAQDANKGAKQLAEYLDLNKDDAAEHETMGYLVVFDGRRQRLSLKATKLDREDGLHFHGEEVEFEPRLWETRSDFRRPRRFFLEPVVSAD
ncbi:MAG TPA: hypothetical protein VFJ65_06760 [Solirubrobacterales bacterium]|nr:hypothetical protein [Solirubrobacterales bacterium]